jgi:hypothetical protein
MNSHIVWSLDRRDGGSLSVILELMIGLDWIRFERLKGQRMEKVGGGSQKCRQS